MVDRRTALPYLRIGVFLVSLVPLARLVFHALTDGLGANPIEEMTHRTGWWTLTFLMLTLSVTPARQLTGWGALIKLRRMLGLFAFFYATIHFSIYVGIDQFFGWQYIIADIMDRPYITVGFTGFVLLIPMAVTSTKKMVKRLGGKRWQALHRAVYIAAALGVLHFLWLVKADIREPAIFAGVLVTLLGYRVATERLRRFRLRRTRSENTRPARSPSSSPAPSSSALAQR